LPYILKCNALGEWRAAATTGGTFSSHSKKIKSIVLENIKK
jgi:hypothetical protein